MIEFRETSNTLHRMGMLSGMKKFTSRIISTDNPDIEATLSKQKSCSSYFGGNSHARLEIRIDGNMN